MKPMREVLNELVGNGNLIAEAIRKGQSLSATDRAIIGRVRREARAEGLSPRVINELEFEGEIGQRGIIAQPIVTHFVGVQMLTKRIGVRYYNIEGDHRLNHSTVDIMELMHNGLMPTDINPFHAWYEYVKEAAVLTWFTIEGWFR